MISAHRIIYNNIESLEFNLIVYAAFDSDNGQVQSYLNQEGIYTEHYDGHRTIHRAKKSEVFSPTFTFIKNNFEDFSLEEVRKILSWLTTSDKPSWLDVFHDDSNAVSYRCFGLWESIELYKLGNGSCVGFTATFTSTHPYAFSHKMELTKKIETPTPLVITSDSDEYLKPIYPTVTIKFSNADIYMPVDKDPTKDNYVMIPNVIYKYGNNYYVNLPSEDVKTQLPTANNPITSTNISNTLADTKVYSLDSYYYFTQDGVIAKMVAIGNTYAWKIVAEVGAAVQIENKTAGTSTIVSGAAIGETIILDGINKVISAYTEVSGALIQETRIIGNHFNWEWLPLNYGENNITITGNCEVKIEWLEPRKVGDL